MELGEQNESSAVIAAAETLKTRMPASEKWSSRDRFKTCRSTAECCSTSLSQCPARTRVTGRRRVR